MNAHSFSIFSWAQNSRIQILLASKISCTFLLLTLKNLGSAMVGLFAAMSKVFFYPNGWFWTCVQDCVQQPSKYSSYHLMPFGRDLDKANYYWRKLRQYCGFFQFRVFLKRRRRVKNWKEKTGWKDCKCQDSSSYLLQSIMTAFSDSCNTCHSKTSSCTAWHFNGTADSHEKGR